MNFETWWNDYDNIQCDKDACEDAFYSGQQSKQKEIDKLTRELEIMKGWEKLAKANGEDKLKYLNIISEALCALESTPYWDRSGNCEIAIAILKKTSE